MTQLSRQWLAAACAGSPHVGVLAAHDLGGAAGGAGHRLEARKELLFLRFEMGLEGGGELGQSLRRIFPLATRGEGFGGPYLAGSSLTAVDAFFAPVAFRIRTYGLDVGAGQAWVDHMLAHPAMIEWERQALAESWREESHEAELTAAGVITADYRTA